MNVLSDGSSIRMADDGAAKVGWDLTYSHLTESELASLRQLFDASFGEWQSFTFLDPVDNLLTWSEDLTQPAWAADPLIALTPGSQDPFGGTAAITLTNSGQTTQQIAQLQPIPGNYQYCLSCYARGAQAAEVELIASNGSEDVQSAYQAGSDWRRASSSFQMSSPAQGVTVGIRLAPGNSVTVFGLQLEAQPGAGTYKKTRDRAGVYPRTRFDGSALQAIATGVNQYSCAVKLLSAVAG